MEGGSQKRFNDSLDESEFDADSYNQLNQIDSGQSAPKRTKKENLNAIAIIVVGIMAIFLGFYQLAEGVLNPFAFLNEETGTQNTTSTPIDSSIDTDNDGLTDYLENNYKTSPYLEDTDGDGIKDGDEAKNGTDPNCPQGQICSGIYNFSSTTSSSAPIFGNAPNTSVAVDIATLRQVMIANGISKEDVDALTDAEILELYNASLADSDQAGLGASATGTYAVPTTLDISSLQIRSLDDMKSLTGAQIKALMIKNGASADLINQVSDDEIKQMFLEKLEENN